MIDLASFAAAFLVLLFFIPIPRMAAERSKKESLLRSAGEGVRWLRKNLGVFHLILFLAAINLVASMYSAAFPAMMLSKPNAGEMAMGVVNAFLGWIAIPWMSTNLEAILRLTIPEEIQGRVFAARNSFQFFTIPVGYFLGGLLVDQLFEPIMASQSANSILTCCFGSGKGSGAAYNERRVLYFVFQSKKNT